MIREREQAVLGQEDFAILLEQSLARTNWQTALIDKEAESTSARISRELVARKLSVERERDIPALWERGSRQMRAGLFNDSYITLDSILQSGFRFGPRNECKLLTQLVGVCVGVVETEDDPSARLDWVNRGYHLYDRLIRHRYYGKDLRTKANGVVQYASLKYQHSFLVDDIDEKRKLLLEGYEIVDSVRDLISSDDLRVQFFLHTSAGFLASSIYRLTELEEGKRDWLILWQQGACKAAELALKLERHESAARQFSFAGLASVHIAEQARLNREQESQKQWMLTSYKLNMQAADLLSRNGDPEGAIYSLTFCAYTATDPILDQEYKKENPDWGKELLYLLTKAIELAKDARDLPRAAHLLSVVLGMANGVVDQVREPHERRELLRIKLEGHMLSGKFEKEITTRQEQHERSQTLKRASVGYGFAGNIARELVVLEGKDSWNEQAYNLYMESADLAYQAGDSQSAANMHSLASDIAGEIAREKRKTTDKIHWMEKCYKGRVKSSELFIESNDINHAAFVLGFVAMVAQKIGELDLNHQKDWDENAFEANVKAGELFISIKDKSHAANSYRIAARIAERMELYLPGEVTKWKRNKRTCLDKYLQLKDQRRE